MISNISPTNNLWTKIIFLIFIFHFIFGKINTIYFESTIKAEITSLTSNLQVE